MGFGEIYKSTWWGEVCQFYPWGKVYYDDADCLPSGNNYSFLYEEGAPAQVVGADNTSSTFKYGLTSGYTLAGWVKANENMFSTGASPIANYSQRCVTDFSSSISSTPSGKGYSLYFRKLATGTRICFWTAFDGLTESNRRVEINLSSEVADVYENTMFVVARLTNNLDGTWTQNLRVYSDWFEENTAQGYVEATNTQTPVSSGMSYPASQGLCFGNTDDGAPTSASEFVGNLDEMSLWSAPISNTQVETLWSYPTHRIHLNLNNSSSAADLTGWYRMGENATWDGAKWDMPNTATGGLPQDDFESNGMVEADRVATIIS
jgi:hypothetical protein